MTRMPKQYDDDDGRVICDMDVDGMPWHDKRLRRLMRAERKSNRMSGGSITKSAARIYTWYAVLAGLVIALVFGAVWALFILFATKVWFR